MAAPAPVTPDTPIVIKISVNGNLKKLKLPLRDLGVSVLPSKVSDKLLHAALNTSLSQHCRLTSIHPHANCLEQLRQVLDIKPEQHMLLERFSDSSGDYVTLAENSPQVFKTLIRAAKAKGKLRLKATVTQETKIEATEEPSARNTKSQAAVRISVSGSTSLDTC